MSSSTENRLSYASSPESDLEVSPPPAPRLVKSSSDPSIATTQDNLDRDDDLTHMADAVPPPYTQGGYGDSKYGFSSNGNGPNNGVNHNGQSSYGGGAPSGDAPPYQMTHSPPHSPLYGTVPELPPRGPASRPVGGVLLPAPPPSRPGHTLRQTPNSNRPSAQERLFGSSKEGGAEEGPSYSMRPTSMVLQSPQGQGQGSLDRHRHPSNTNSYDGTSSYEYSSASPACAAPPSAGSCRLPPNAPDDLKVAPPNKLEPPPPPNPSAMSAHSPQRGAPHDHSSLEYRPADNYRPSDPYRSPHVRPPAPASGVGPGGALAPHHSRGPSLPAVPTNDHAKYSSRTNSASQADYGGRGGGGGGGVGGVPVPPYKPVPPPKPKHYRPPDTAPPRNGAPESAAVITPRTPGYAPHYSHQHSLSQPTHHRPHNYHQPNMYGSQMAPQSPPYSGPPTQHRSINLPHNPHLIDLAGSREQRGSAFELYRKPQHMHNISSSDAMNSSVERDETFSPKTKKKLSKKPSFIKNAVLDLFRSKTKNSQKVSRQKSLCESDLQQRHSTHQMPMLRREKSDLSDMSVHMRNTQIRNQMIQRTNSSCDKSILKPVLKQQPFCDEMNGSACTVRDYDGKTSIKSLRRQNSMCEIETEPKVTPLLRRQNSLIEYNRRGIYGQTCSFNMITKIDPIYQREQVIKHEPFHPTQPLPPEPVYQSKEHIVYDPIPKPRRTYASLYDTSSENPYMSRSEVLNQSFENPYGNHQTIAMPILDPPYATRAECEKANSFQIRNETGAESPYVSSHEINKRFESHYESSSSNKDQMSRQSPYATKEEMLRQRFSESPYTTKDEISKQRLEYYFNKDPLLGKRTYEPPASTSWSESPCSVRPERRLHTPVSFPGKVFPTNKCMSEPPYSTRTEMMARLNQTESPYGTRAEVKSSCSDSHYNTHNENLENRQDFRPSSAECAYVSKQEILSQKALLANRESTYSIRLEEKLEIIKQRNQAKKDMIYQSRKEANETDIPKVREPLYVSKRELKESVIYESQQEAKELSNTNVQEGSARNSPYELSDANHLSRREPVYQSKREIEKENDIFREIDFSKLRLTESKTDAEKEKFLNSESCVLKGEPIYAPRLHGKVDHISNALKTTSSPIPYESTTSMETHYTSECSMNFENKPQSTPYASQDVDERSTKPNRTVTFFENIIEKSPECSQDNSENISCSQNDTTVMENQTTVMQATITEGNDNNSSKVEGVEPDGPHTTWGIFDSEGGILEDRQWGVSLIIPPKAIAPGIKQKIYFTVSDPRLSQRVGGPPIDMDNGEAMLSPLVMCGPQGLVFLRPVTLRLPHCANAVPSLGLTIKATDTEAHLSTDWDQIHLPATTTLNTVAVKVDHF